MARDMDSLKIEYTHVVHLYSDLCAYLKFMVHDGNIEEPTYNMMQKTLSEIFENYKLLSLELEHYIEPFASQKLIDDKIEKIKENNNNVDGILQDIPDETDIKRIQKYCIESNKLLKEIKDEVQFTFWRD